MPLTKLPLQEVGGRTLFSHSSFHSVLTYSFSYCSPLLITLSFLP
ncbi:hypothetical protein DB29_01608 [Shouchella clausii]|nr:hypothetical protein DB29_01608 [Shouchella clausii]